MIVSSGQEMKTFAALTDDPVGVLHGAVDEVEGDRKQWDPWVMSEESRIREVIEYINKGMLDQARSTAARHQSEERWRTEKELRRFLDDPGPPGDIDPPKVVVYFADTMRSNPGEHYLGFFSALDRRSDPALRSSALDCVRVRELLRPRHRRGQRSRRAPVHGRGPGTDIRHADLDRRDAKAVRGPGSDPHPTAHHRRSGQPGRPRARDRRPGVSQRSQVASKIAKRIEQDLACVYVMSFDGSGAPGGQSVGGPAPRASPQRSRPRHAGVLVVQSESRALTSRLLASFAAPEAVEAEIRSQSVLIPTGYVDGTIQRSRAAVRSGLAGLRRPRGISGCPWSRVARSGRTRPGASRFRCPASRSCSRPR